MKTFVLALLCMGMVSCSSGAKRSIASYTQNDLKSMVHRLISTYAQKAYEVNVYDSPNAIEFHIAYHFEDHLNVTGYAGVRKRNLQTLIIEQYMGEQKKLALAENRDFKASEVKTILVTFEAMQE
jgi:hypothetical protein